MIIKGKDRILFDMERGTGERNVSERLSDGDRRAIISRIHSLLFWVGRFVPQHEIIEGEDIDLRDIIFQFVSKEDPTPEEIRGAKDLADRLEKRPENWKRRSRPRTSPRQTHTK